jgi:invasion protein IalB
VLNVSIARPEKDKPYVAAITAPLGILLPAGLTLQVDEKELVKFALRLCNVNGCQGQFPVTPDVQKIFSEGKNGRVIFRQPNGRPLRVEFSLNGFADGMTELEKN